MAVQLVNSEVEVSIRPDLGGRIDQLHDRKTGKDWLWHPPGYDPTQIRSLPVGASFDEHWTGGWDEIFPNDAAGDFRGRSLVDHGELWSQEWETVEAQADRVRLVRECQTVPVRIEKMVQLHATQPQVQITYQFRNLSQEVLPFLFKQHAAIAIEAGDEILLPSCMVEPVALEFSKIIGQAEPTRFPAALDAYGQPVQLNRVPPPSSQLQEFYYCSTLETGRCGIRNEKTQTALVMEFDQADFPYVWVFQSYGGWHGHYVLVLEPCTTMPYDLEIACQKGTIAQLQPGESQQRGLTVRLERS